MSTCKITFFGVSLSLIIYCWVIAAYTFARKHDGAEKPNWAKKDISDYSEADLERLFDQWEEGEDPLPVDERPEHERPQPTIDFNKIKNANPEELMKLSKKGRTLMVFVKVNGNPTKDETETVTKLWQSSLFNNHIQCERYLIDDNRAIFVFKDGSQAWDAKDYLVQQERLDSVTIESKEYPGKFQQKETCKPSSEKSLGKDEL